MDLSRRRLLSAGALALGGLSLPLRLAASSTGQQRRFVFVFCPGGWDTSLVFAPVFSSSVDRPSGDVAAQVGDLPFVDSPSRPTVRAFLETWGSQTCFVNGWQVPSVAHDVCTRLTMTGTPTASQDDWVSIVASEAGAEQVMPNVHIDGPIFPVRFPTTSVRVGASGQLSALLDGTALLRSDSGVLFPPSQQRLDLASQVLQARVDRFAGRSSELGRTIADATSLGLSRARQLTPYASALAPNLEDRLGSAVDIALSSLELGLSRTASLAYGSGGNGEWDTHTNNALQDELFEAVFGALDRLCLGLDATAAPEGGTLLEHTTIVVLSEMGRTPEYNSAAGKDHWPFTSAMFIGSGIRGGQAIGGFNDGLEGLPVDLESGAPDEGGVTMLPGHIGASILALADIDPEEWVPAEVGGPISALLKG